MKQAHPGQAAGERVQVLQVAERGPALPAEGEAPAAKRAFPWREKPDAKYWGPAPSWRQKTEAARQAALPVSAMALLRAEAAEPLRQAGAAAFSEPVLQVVAGGRAFLPLA